VPQGGGKVMLHDPAVTLTDYLLTVQCSVFAVLLAREQVGTVRFAFVLFFVSAAAAAFLGGTVHGFFPDPAGTPNHVLWTATMLSIGVTTVAIALIAIGIGLPEARAAKLTPLIVLMYIGYAAYVVFVDNEFIIAIVTYLPATLLLFAVFVRRWMECRAPAARLGMAGIGVALVGAVMQQAGVALHPVYFNHNALYHVFQGVAFYLLFRAAYAWMHQPS